MKGVFGGIIDVFNFLGGCLLCICIGNKWAFKDDSNVRWIRLITIAITIISIISVIANFHAGDIFILSFYVTAPILGLELLKRFIEKQ